MQIPVAYEDPGSGRESLQLLIDAGFSHVVLNPPAPYPSDVVRWVTDELITPTLEYAHRAL